MRTKGQTHHSKLLNHICLVNKVSLWALDSDCIANLHFVNKLRDHALGIRLDQQVDVTEIVIGADWRITARDLLSISLDHQRNMLSDWKSQD